MPCRSCSLNEAFLTLSINRYVWSGESELLLTVLSPCFLFPVLHNEKDKCVERKGAARPNKRRLIYSIFKSVNCVLTIN